MTITLLNNRYQVIQILGDGGFGKTFLAEDTYMPSRRHCVIKQLKPITNDPQTYQIIQQRFEREAATLEYLGEHSDQIPKLYAYFLESGQFYLVQEWIQGQTLREIVVAKGYEKEATVKAFLISLLSVLDYVHSKGIIHRDIKPDNIILRERDLKPVLIDFGAVKETIRSVAGASSYATRSIVIGTPGYMPIEQVAGRPVYATDIYSLGLTAIYLLTGNNPEQLQTNPQTGEILWQQYAPHVSPDLASVLNQAIKPQASERYSTASKMLYALQSLSFIPSTSYQSAQSTIPLSPIAASTQGLSSSQKSAFIRASATDANWQKPALIFSGLVMGVLIGGTVIANFTHQSQPETTIATSPAPTPTQEFPAINPSPLPLPITPTNEPENTPVASQPSPEQPITSVPSLPPVAYIPEPQAQPTQQKPISVPQLKQENQQKVATNTTSDNILELPTGTELSPSPPSISQSAKPKTVVSLQESPSLQQTIHKGYCTFIAINKNENIVDDPCSINDYKNGNYKLIWSNGKESDIATNPSVLLDNNPASIINSGASHITVKSTQGRIGFCWNCNP
ncbi:serine/threonine-protein kinase [Nostoc sp. UIC 10630]|uniref:serine/threonine-protein kinase n=1 Tax=Nostoc sp. UIC 10630 TaxID=2100146 RepID=UPI0013D51589|nr:serine/threonine-protein kinase [Nostoc sp. UIC 10630]NEU80977.1 protein kinase [Nostoc sp. UIC 10630]